jgi:3-oxoacyl-[acyl-carrier-protein] synthase-3
MLYLHSAGHFHPETVITNHFLLDLDIGLTTRHLNRIGIEERRTVLALDYIRTTKNKEPNAARDACTYDNAETGALAARMAMDRARIAASDIGLVVSGGCSPEYSVPPEAAVVAEKLGIAAPVFDLSSGCCTFTAQMHFLNSMRSEALPDYVLLVSIENSTRVIDYSDLHNAAIIGDASAAAIVSPRVPADFCVGFTMHQSATTGWRSAALPVGGHFKQVGSEMKSFAFEKAPTVVQCLKQRGKLNDCNFHFISHQVTLPLLNGICTRCDIPSEMHLFNVDRFGSCASAGAPSVLSQEWENLTQKDVLVAVFGAGLSWGGFLIRNEGPLKRHP